MKKLPLYALLLSLGLFSVGCEAEPEAVPPAGDTTTDGAAGGTGTTTGGTTTGEGM